MSASPDFLLRGSKAAEHHSNTIPGSHLAGCEHGHSHRSFDAVQICDHWSALKKERLCLTQDAATILKFFLRRKKKGRNRHAEKKYLRQVTHCQTTDVFSLHTAREPESCARHLAAISAPPRETDAVDFTNATNYGRAKIKARFDATSILNVQRSLMVFGF